MRDALETGAVLCVLKSPAKGAGNPGWKIGVLPIHPVAVKAQSSSAANASRGPSHLSPGAVLSCLPESSQTGGRAGLPTLHEGGRSRGLLGSDEAGESFKVTLQITGRW